jgi:hypothetical protein
LRRIRIKAWEILGEFLPTSPERLTAFLDSLSVESSTGIAPVGYEYREYKDWRGVPKPAALPVLQTSKGRDPKGEGDL